MLFHDKVGLSGLSEMNVCSHIQNSRFMKKEAITNYGELDIKKTFKTSIKRRTFLKCFLRWFLKQPHQRNSHVVFDIFFEYGNGRFHN